MDTFRGIVGRVVALSSMDVYRAMGVFYGFEPGGLQELPLTEASDLRTSRNVYSAEALKKVRSVYEWIGDEYDKIPVEQAVLSDPKLSGTVFAVAHDLRPRGSTASLSSNIEAHRRWPKANHFFR